MSESNKDSPVDVISLWESLANTMKSALFDGQEMLAPGVFKEWSSELPKIKDMASHLSCDISAKVKWELLKLSVPLLILVPDQEVSVFLKEHPWFRQLLTKRNERFSSSLLDLVLTDKLYSDFFKTPKGEVFFEKLIVSLRSRCLNLGLSGSPPESNFLASLALNDDVVLFKMLVKHSHRNMLNPNMGDWAVKRKTFHYAIHTPEFLTAALDAGVDFEAWVKRFSKPGLSLNAVPKNVHFLLKESPAESMKMIRAFEAHPSLNSELLKDWYINTLSVIKIQLEDSENNKFHERSIAFLMHIIEKFPDHPTWQIQQDNGKVSFYQFLENHNREDCVSHSKVLLSGLKSVSKDLKPVRF